MFHLFIINKQAGKQTGINNLLLQIQQFYSDLEHSVVYPTSQRELVRIINQHTNKKDLILYACGGDGTLHSVVNAIAELSLWRCKVIIIPIGTGNDFIKSLGVNREVLLDLTNYQDITSKTVDVLKIDDIYGINTASVGMDVKVAKEVHRFKKLPFNSSTIPYFMALITTIIQDNTQYCKLVIDDDTTIEDDYSFIVAGNGKYYGGGYLPNPQAEVNDGFIDLCLIKKVPRAVIVGLQVLYKKGKHIKFTSLVNQVRCKKIQLLGGNDIDLNIDGEVFHLKNPTIELLPQKLTLYLPKEK